MAFLRNINRQHPYSGVAFIRRFAVFKIRSGRYLTIWLNSPLLYRYPLYANGNQSQALVSGLIIVDNTLPHKARLASGWTPVWTRFGGCFWSPNILAYTYSSGIQYNHHHEGDPYEVPSSSGAFLFLFVNTSFLSLF